MYYMIKQMAQMFDVTEHTLRYYTDLGLLANGTGATAVCLTRNRSTGCRGLSA
jgi:hypothetical protein